MAHEAEQRAIVEEQARQRQVVHQPEQGLEIAARERDAELQHQAAPRAHQDIQPQLQVQEQPQLSQKPHGLESREREQLPAAHRLSDVTQ